GAAHRLVARSPERALSPTGVCDEQLPCAVGLGVQPPDVRHKRGEVERSMVRAVAAGAVRRRGYGVLGVEPLSHLPPPRVLELHRPVERVLCRHTVNALGLDAVLTLERL